MKKCSFRALLTLLVCAAFLFGFAACGQPDQIIEVELEQASSQPEAEEPAVPEVELPVEEPSAEEPPLGFPIPDWMEQELSVMDNLFE